MTDKHSQKIADLVRVTEGQHQRLALAQSLLSGALQILDEDDISGLAAAKLSEVLVMVEEILQRGGDYKV